MVIIIPSHGRDHVLLDRTLNSIAQCKLPESYRKLVVIENGGTDFGVRDLVDALPGSLNAQYMYRERGNKSHALNEALETISDGLVVFFDDDVIVEQDVLVKYAEAAREYGEGSFFGGPTRPDYEKEPPDWLRTLMPPSMSGKRLEDWDENTRFLGFNWAAFAQDLMEVGGFDPSFGPGSPFDASGQEDDMQARLIRAGKDGVVVDAMVWHHVPAEKCTLETVVDRTHSAAISAGLSTDVWRALLRYPVFLASIPLRVGKYVLEGKPYKTRPMWASFAGKVRGLMYRITSSE